MNRLTCLLILLILLIPLSACTATKPADQIPAGQIVERGPDGWATTRIVADDNLPFPLRDKRLLVAIDGTLVYSGTPPRDAGLVGLVELEPGDHQLSIQLTATYQAGLAVGDDCRLKLRTVRAFSVDGFERGRIALNLHLKGNVLRALDERVAVRMSFSGISENPVGYPPTRWTEEDQAVRTPTDAVLVLKRRLADARAQRDIVKVLCQRDKLNQAEVVERAYVERGQAAALTDDPAERRHQQTIRAVLKEKARMLVKESSQCVCVYPAFSEPHVVTLDGICAAPPDHPQPPRW